MGEYNHWREMDDREFRTTSGEVALSIQKFVQNTNFLQRLIGSTHINGSFDKKMFEEISSILSKNTELSKKINTYLSLIEGIAARYPSKERSLQIKSFKENYSEANKNFKSLQETALKKERENMNVYAISSSQNKKKEYPLLDLSSLEEDQRGVDVERHEELSLSGRLSQTQTCRRTDEMKRLHELEERREAMAQLESDISDVNVVFKDLSLMIQDQGNIVDSIEGNVASAEDDIKYGREMIVFAHGIQKSTRKKKIVLIVLVICVISVIAGFVAWEFRPSSD